MSEGAQDARMMEIIGRSWADEQFRKRLLADPAGVMKAEGITIPPGVSLRVVEDTETVFHFVLPVKAAAAAELSDDELDKVAGGAGAVQGRKVPTGTSQYS